MLLDIYIFFLKLQYSAIYSEEETEFKIMVCDRVWWNFEKRVYVAIEQILPGDGGHDSSTATGSVARWRLLGGSDVSRRLPLATGPGSWVGAV
jgi:hypothetical protein